MSKKPKKTAGQDQDDSTLRLANIYKKKCQLNNITQSKLFKEKLEAALQQGHLQKLQMWEELSPVGVRALAESWSEISYKHLKVLRLWKVRAGDQGVRCLCNFMEKTKTLQYLDLLDNQITALGCEFLGKVLHPTVGLPLLKLKLNHNPFGTQGLINLAEGLASNCILQKLSLKYCQIDSNGAKPIQQILANIETKLQSLKLQGNRLFNEGAFQIFRALRVNTSVQKVSFGDCQLLMDDKPLSIQLINKICQVMETTTNIHTLDFGYNVITVQNATRLINAIRENTTICKVQLWDQLPREVQQLLTTVTKKRKPKKKKKDKKKKKASKK